MKRKASAVWQGGLKEGHGTASTESGLLDGAPYSFRTRFEEGTGTNPEELVGAAHAACFSMALAAQLGASGHPPERIETTATVTLEKSGEGFAVAAIHLDLVANVPGIDGARFQHLAREAKETCPISQLFNAPITLNVALAD